MPAQKKIPPPVDRPLSKAYLRQFAGWSTAFPPGQSEPNSLRHMENVWIDRNGAVEVRPGLHYLSYTLSPDLDPLLPSNPGNSLGLPVVGEPELFYTTEGDRALLMAVREAGGEVGFRAVLFTETNRVVFELDEQEVGFAIPQGKDALNFSADCTYVHFLQINNRILALSDSGEAARMFYVGGQKLAKKLKAISMPEWQDSDKLEAMHPNAAWINDQNPTIRVNTVLNPSFEIGTKFWSGSDRAELQAVKADDAPAGSYVLELTSAPARTNMIPVPLTSSNALEQGWHAADDDTDLQPVGTWLQIASVEEGVYYVDGPRIIAEVESGGDYRVAFDYDCDEGAAAYLRFTSFAPNGAELGHFDVEVGSSGGRWESPSLTASTGATSLRVSLGGSGGAVRFKNVLVCPDGQETSIFDGNSGEDYFWTGVSHQSASVHHPPVTVHAESQPYPIRGQGRAEARFDAWTTDTRNVSLVIVSYDSAGTPHEETSYTNNVGEVWETLSSPEGSWNSSAVSASVRAEAHLSRGEVLRVDRAMLEFTDAVDPEYFDGSTPSTAQALNSWQGLLTHLAHESPSEQRVLSGSAALVPETPAANTLVSNQSTKNNKNTYKMGFFYTFENEIGESAASRVTEIRMMRPWSNWIWETPNAAGEPSGTYTDTAELVADQIVVRMPQEVYDQAVAEGALRWNLYAFAWSDQQPVPLEAQLVDYRDIYTDIATVGAQPLPYSIGGWMQVTPSRKASIDTMILPTAENRVNSSIPPSHRNGTVAGDRMILVGSPFDAATIAWSSNKAGQYTRFSPNRGGGRKTLTTGNLNLPYAVVLWQNPQSVDTLTILCSDDNGRSTAYYMAPADIQGGSTGLTDVMGFEETTATPGTVAPYAAEVLNNALYRPLDRSLMKSTASNYNINHKTMTDSIANMWWLLEQKQWMMSAQLDNRLYYLVHNPLGELLLPDCKGNEIWVYDIAAEKGHWSRFLVQGSALHAFTVGTRTYLGVSRPDGLYYLDESQLMDDYVDLDDKVRERTIQWRFETNTQGANRAHDAWAHLQQVGVTFGNWQGSARYGVRGIDMHGKRVHATKIFSDTEDPGPRGESWDVDDALLIRRDMKEWFFYAESLTGTQGSGQIGIVQYRYTPTTVNIGYEMGSVETFEYGSDEGGPGSVYSRNGIPLPYVDYDRP